MPNCHCGQLAEVEWEVLGEKERRQMHQLCGSCMSVIWSKINLDFPSSNAQQCSVFRSI